MSINSEIQDKRTKTFIANKGSLADVYPNSLKFWHPTKNGALTPYDITAHTKKVVWWYCNMCGYEWQASVLTRGKAKCCPVCCGQKVVTGINDFATFAPNIASEWDYNKNLSNINPTLVTTHSHKKGWWICKECGHSYMATFENRFLGEGCKICGYKTVGNKVIERALENNGSLQSTNSQLLKDWDYAKNAINPDNVPIMSRQYVWWKCNVCGHEWCATVNSRTCGNGCPECARTTNRSKLQTMVDNYITEKYKYSLLHEHQCTLKIRNTSTNTLMPYDNEIVELKLIIEVHGEQHYIPNRLTLLVAKYRNITPEQALADQQYRDRIKKEYAISQGYEYLEIPYWSEKDESYKQLIDEKILTLTQQNN